MKVESLSYAIPRHRKRFSIYVSRIQYYIKYYPTYFKMYYLKKKS